MMKEQKPKEKKTYQPPKVESKDIYQVNALACGKCPSIQNISVQPACIQIKRFS